MTMLTKVAAKLLAGIGLLKLIRWYHRDKIIIIYLHSVVDASKLNWHPLRRPFPIELLRRQLKVIDRHYNWLSLDDAVEMLSGRKPFVANGVVLTFDDGYRNNMTVALPELEPYMIKPVFYAATSLLNNRKPYWFERFDYVIQQLKEPMEIPLHGQTFTFTPGNRESLRNTYTALRQAAKEEFENDRDFYDFFETTSDRLERTCGKSLAEIQAGDPCSETLSDEELRALEETGRVTIGSHTVDHVRLDTVDEYSCMEQLTASRAYLESATGVRCRHFCYPNGNWNSQVASAVAAAGYVSAVTTEYGLNGLGADLLSLKRMHMPKMSDKNQLMLFLAGLGNLRDRIAGLIRFRGSKGLSGPARHRTAYRTSGEYPGHD
jgi:peptidoglycan/xylan/chitin deacetylase (PgdA/CDA1 family)